MLFVAIFCLRVKNLIIWSVLSHFVQWHFFLILPEFNFRFGWFHTRNWPFLTCQILLKSVSKHMDIILFLIKVMSMEEFDLKYYFRLHACPSSNCRLSEIALQRVPYPKQKTLSHQRKLLIKLVVYASAMKKKITRYLYCPLVVVWGYFPNIFDNSESLNLDNILTDKSLCPYIHKYVRTYVARNL